MVRVQGVQRDATEDGRVWHVTGTPNANIFTAGCPAATYGYKLIERTQKLSIFVTTSFVVEYATLASVGPAEQKVACLTRYVTLRIGS